MKYLTRLAILIAVPTILWLILEPEMWFTRVLSLLIILIVVAVCWHVNEEHIRENVRDKSKRT
jgi:hypothetical protein